MTLFIPLVCEDVQEMTPEEYLEILAGVFTEYFHEAMSEDKFYFRFGEGVMLDTLLEEWMELDGSVKLFTGDPSMVEEFVSAYDRDPIYVASSPREKFGFTPGVVDEAGLVKYQEHFDAVTVLPTRADDQISPMVTPCFSVTVLEEPLRSQGDQLEDMIREFTGVIQEATGAIEPEKFHAWAEANHPLRLFTVSDPSELAASNAQNLHPSSDGKCTIYFIDHPDTDDNEGTSDEDR